jgi:hypothetical protein
VTPPLSRPWPDPWSAVWHQAGRRMAATERRMTERDREWFTGSHDWLEGLGRRHSKHVYSVDES